MKQTLVLFDIDGTLLYSNKIDSRCFAQTYQTIYQVEFPTIDWRHYSHVSDHTIFSEAFNMHFGREPRQTEIDHFQERFVALIQQKRIENPDDFKEVPGARAILDHLLSQRYPVGIATGGWQRPASVKLAHIGIDSSCLHDSYADNKESREAILQHAIDQAKAAGVPVQRIVYVGDALWDVQTTRNMGINFIGIRLKGDRHELHNAGAKHVLQDYRDVAAFMHYVKVATPPVG